MYLKNIILVLLITSTLWSLEINVPTRQVQVVPIIEAIKAKKYKRFQKLFDKTKLYKRYSQNQTLLHIATRYNNQRVAKLLIQKGAQLDAIGGEYSDTALHTAIRYGYLQMAVYLIKNNIPLNLKDKYGETALDIAVRLDYDNIIELLKKKGAIRGKVSNEEKSSGDKRVNKYRDGRAVNKYKGDGVINKYENSTIKGKKIELRHNMLESENEDKNNKSLGPKNSKIDIGN